MHWIKFSFRLMKRDWVGLCKIAVEGTDGHQNFQLSSSLQQPFLTPGKFIPGITRPMLSHKSCTSGCSIAAMGRGQSCFLLALMSNGKEWFHIKLFQLHPPKRHPPHAGHVTPRIIFPGVRGGYWEEEKAEIGNPCAVLVLNPAHWAHTLLKKTENCCCVPLASVQQWWEFLRTWHENKGEYKSHGIKQERPLDSIIRAQIGWKDWQKTLYIVKQFCNGIK